jgi:hypothetical protein
MVREEKGEEERERVGNKIHGDVRHLRCEEAYPVQHTDVLYVPTSSVRS